MREKAEDPYVSLGICSRCHKGILGTQYKMCAECREKKAKVEAKRLARETRDLINSSESSNGTFL